MTTKTKGITLGDLLIHEESALFCRTLGTIKNGEATAVTLVVGMPVIADSTNFELALAAEHASINGILLEGGDTIAATTTSSKKYPVLVRGPAVLNSAKLPTADQADSAWSLANIKTRLLTLNIITKDEPTKSSYQTN